MMYIEEHLNERDYFMIDGNKDLYVQFRQDPKIRIFHTEVHSFISRHLPKS